MNNLTSDYIVIDTNIFEHLFNPQNNINGHITGLFDFLLKDKINLLVDSKGRIHAEYKHRLAQKIQQAYEQPKIRSILKYYLAPANHKPIDVDQGRELMAQIGRIVLNSTDRVFVYVAFREGKKLITNDENDFIHEGNRRDRRRRNLREIKLDHRSDILTSQEAYDMISADFA